MSDSQAAILLVAELLDGPCPDCVKHPGYARQLYKVDELIEQVPTCATCDGTGRVFPLRMPCPGVHSRACPARFSYEEHGWTNPPSTCVCKLRSWTPNTSMHDWLAAVRAKGWQFRVTGYLRWGDTEDVGDMVEWWWVDGQLKALVDPSEGLRGMDAIAVAVARALEA